VRRKFLVITIAALMSVIMVFGAGPALAQKIADSGGQGGHVNHQDKVLKDVCLILAGLCSDDGDDQGGAS
jgi:hypothetical protein